MSEETKHRRVTWHDNGRGPRVVIDIGGESVVTTAALARELRDDLTAALDEIEEDTRAEVTPMTARPSIVELQRETSRWPTHTDTTRRGSPKS